MSNLLAALAAPAMTGRHLAHDLFRDELVIAGADVPVEAAQWRLFRDSDYAFLRRELEQRGFRPMGMELLRLAVLAVAEGNAFDTAREWLSRLAWDGVRRVDSFAHRAWAWADNAYAIAVSRYVWSALAGRIIQPGVQADMAPILVGPQGYGKTSVVKAMAPDPSFYAEIKLTERDENMSRLMRGTLVGELEELRGLNSRAMEEIKAFISRTHEKWVPKYREFSTTYPRRLLFVGTTNEEEGFLADPTGERRWLPGRCRAPLDVPYVQRWRDQLWAEGAAMFLLDGVAYHEAETLGRLEHDEFKVRDAWEQPIARWLMEGQLEAGALVRDAEWVGMADIAGGALHIMPSQLDRAREVRIGKVMKTLGWQRKRMPSAADPKRPWAYTQGGE